MTGDAGTSVHLSQELYEELAREAEARGVSVRWFVGKLLREGLDRLIPAEEFSLTRPREER